jgi:hypothetical protein
VNTFNVVPYLMYLAKQKRRLLKNCFNEVLLSDWHMPEVFCEQNLPDKIDFSLWNDA